MEKPIVNISDADLMDFGSPKGKFKARLGRLGPVLGAEKLGAMLTIIEPGCCAFPFHKHHAIEEMFYIIEGTGEYRYGAKTYKIRPGDLLSAPVGERGEAHQIVNSGDAPLKFLAFSTMDDVDIVEYPDSDKFRSYSAGEGGDPRNARFNVLTRTGAAADFFEGEE
jgi:uncharacterized cupin superfamily protein